MSATNSAVPVTTTQTNSGYTITVGTAGQYANAGDVDISASVNAALNAAPAGAPITLIFNPGVYGETNTILLPSNTTVIGNNSTLGNIFNPAAPQGGSALMANRDAYDINNTLYQTSTDGTVTAKPYSSATATFVGNSPIIDSNISIQGMTFNETQATADGDQYSNIYTGMFGTWFTNASNIDVQNNTYIGGTDGNAFVNVVNAVASDDIAIGMINVAYDNWNGTSDTTIQDSAVMMSAYYGCGWAILVNSCPSGDPNNPGDATNVGIINNEISSQIAYQTAVLVAPLDTTYNSESNITVQGNIDSALGSVDPGGFFSASASLSSIIDNIASGGITNGSLASSEFNLGAAAFLMGATPVQNNLEGNLTLGAMLGPNASALAASGKLIDVNNNAAFNVGQTIISEAPIALSIEASPTVFMTPGSTSAIGDLAIEASSGTISASVTILTHFGSLSLPSTISDVKYETIDGENGMILSGSIDSINLALSELEYSSNSGGWDDSIEISANIGNGEFATRYIPVEVLGASTQDDLVTTIAPGLINAAEWNNILFPNDSTSSNVTLSGSILVASAGNDSISMGTTASVAFLGVGNYYLEGGTLQEYISTGSGNASLELDQGGDITVAGGAGNLVVDALSGNDLIETGASAATVSGGNNAVSVLGGLGRITFNGSSGTSFISTLPEDSGDMTANLGNGGSKVYALSGDDSISSPANSANFVELGSGKDTVTSAGKDTIYCGSGAATINILAGAVDNIVEGSGPIIVRAAELATIQAPLDYQSLSQNEVQSNSVQLTGAAPIFVSGFNSEITSAMTSNGEVYSISGGAAVCAEGGHDEIIGGTGTLQFTTNTVAGSYLIDGRKGSAIVTVNSGVVSVLGGQRGATVSGANALQIYAVLGSGGGDVQGSLMGTTVITTTRNANDTISAGQLSSGNAVISSAGDDTIVIGGISTVSAANGSRDTISVAGSAVDYNIGNSSACGGALANVDMLSGQATISIFGLSHMLLSFNNNKSSTLDFINQSCLPHTVPGGSLGSTTVSGGVGGGAYTGGQAGNNVLIGGSGAVTLTSAGSNNFLESNSDLATNCLVASTGNETLIGSSMSGSNKFEIGTDSRDIVEMLGTGQQTFICMGDSSTSASITGSVAASAFNIFDFVGDSATGGGAYCITNFIANNSLIEFTNAEQTGGGTASIESIIGSTGTGQLSTTILLSDNTSIKLLGVAANTLTYHTLQNGVIQLI